MIYAKDYKGHKKGEKVDLPENQLKTAIARGAVKEQKKVYAKKVEVQPETK